MELSVKVYLRSLNTSDMYIEACDADLVMNSKSEWGSSRLPRLTLEVDEAVQQEDFRGAKQGRRPIVVMFYFD